MSDVARTTGRGFLVITAAKAWFEECIQSGAKLGLQATPSLYLNGKPVPNFRREALQAVVDHVLGR